MKSVPTDSSVSHSRKSRIGSSCLAHFIAEHNNIGVLVVKEELGEWGKGVSHFTDYQSNTNADHNLMNISIVLQKKQLMTHDIF